MEKPVVKKRVPLSTNEIFRNQQIIQTAKNEERKKAFKELERREIVQSEKKVEADKEAPEKKVEADKEAPEKKVEAVKKKRVAKTKSTTIAKLDGASVTAEAIGKLVSDLPAGDGIKYKIVAIKPI
jgi:hypothetical protein